MTSIQQSSAPLNISMNPFSDWQRDFEITHLTTGDPVDLMDETIYWQWAQFGSPHSIEHTFTIDEGITWINQTEGIFSINVDVKSIWDSHPHSDVLKFEHTLYRLKDGLKDAVFEGVIKVGINV